MTAIFIAAILVAVIVLVGDLRIVGRKAAPSGPASEDAAVAEPKPYLPFILPSWAKTAILFIASLGIGLIVSTFLGPVIALIALGLAGFVVYYRTAAGKKKVDQVLADLKKRAETTVETPSVAPAAAPSPAKAGSPEIEPTVIDLRPREIQHSPSTSSAASVDQLLDQLVSTTRIARAARRTLDGDLLPALATQPADERDPQRSFLVGAVQNNRATVDQAKMLADQAIIQLVGHLARDGVRSNAAIQDALTKEGVAQDGALSGLLRQMISSSEMSRFDEVGYRKLIQDMWVRATENPGLQNSPI